MSCAFFVKLGARCRRVNEALCGVYSRWRLHENEMALTFRGVAHGPGKSTRNHHADLSSGELVGVAQGSLNGLPLHIEHDTGSASVGSVLTSYMGSRGELRVMGQIDDIDTAKRVRSGELRGLSLGTDCVQDEAGNTLSRKQKELSVCEEGRRTGTWITHIGNKQVHEVACFSARQGVCAEPSRYVEKITHHSVH